MPPPQQQNQSDNSLGFLWIIIGLFIAAIIIWSVWKAVIISIIFKFKLLEINIISLFTDELLSLKQTLLTTPADNFTFDHVKAVCAVIGEYIRLPFAITVAIFAVMVYFGSPVLHLRKIFDMKRLRDAELEDWPQILPASQLDLVTEDINKGPWAMSQTPIQFAEKNKLISLEAIPFQEELLERAQRYKTLLDKGAANRIFALQLGPKWKGVEALKPHMRALFAVFSALANRDRRTALNCLRAIASSGRKGKLNFSGTDELLKKYKDTPLVKHVVAHHAYIYTVMPSMLDLARTDGVMATAEFLWLKTVDRRLWYILNTVGRYTVVPEVAGIYAHWLAEKLLRKPLVVPMVEEASHALELALNERVYHPSVEEPQEKGELTNG